MHNFKELKVWSKARELTKMVYLLTSKFPPEEKYGITAQIRRSVVSISSNIAEGCCRSTHKEVARFIDIALGSAFESESLLLLSIDLGFVNSYEVQSIINQIEETQKMLNGFKCKILN